MTEESFSFFMSSSTFLSVTFAYAKVTDDKIDSDTNALNERIAERFSVVI